MIDLESRKQFVISQLGPDYIDAGSNELRYQCPNCMELGKTYTDYKLYVNYGPKWQRNKIRGGKFWCHRCECTGKLNLDDAFESNSEAIDLLMNLKLEDESSEESEPEYYMIPKSTPIEGTIAWEYILSRGITPEDIKFYDIRVPSLVDNKLFFGRFVVPNIVTGKIFTDMYVARDFLDRGKDVRYKNPFSSARNQIVFNLHRIPQNPPIIKINEGCINSIIAGTDSVATFGKYVSNEQLDMILKKKPERVYVSLDRDALSKAEELCNRIKSKTDSCKVYLVEFDDDRDASDLGRDVYQSKIESAREYTSKTIYVIENFLTSMK